MMTTRMNEMIKQALSKSQVYVQAYTVEATTTGTSQVLEMPYLSTSDYVVIATPIASGSGDVYVTKDSTSQVTVYTTSDDKNVDIVLIGVTG